jgi:ABC-type polysaccharide transport system permease subunit
MMISGLLYILINNYLPMLGLVIVSYLVYVFLSMDTGLVISPRLSLLAWEILCSTRKRNIGHLS